MWTRLWNRLTFPLRARRFDRDLSAELDFHQALLEADHRRAGLADADAAARARRQMGNIAMTREDAREAWLIGWIDAFARDVRYTARIFARNPVFTTIAVVTLALGIGANTAIFRVMDAVMLRMLPVRAPQELLVIRGLWAYPRFAQLRDRNTIFSAVVATHTLRSAELDIDGRSIGRGGVELVSGNYFSVLGVDALIGRPLSTDDDRAPEISPVAVISYAFWRRAFGATDALGRTLHVRGAATGSAGTSGFEAPGTTNRHHEDVALTIVGIAPPEFFGDTVGTSIDVWTPMMMQPALMPGRQWLTRTTATWVSIMGRLRPGVTGDQARGVLTTLTRQIRMDEIGPGISDTQRAGLARVVVNVESGDKGFAQLRREFSQPLMVLAAVVGLVLLIACLNVANLLLARAAARQQEISVRLSLGASRSRLVRQLMTESLVLAAFGGGLGLLFARLGTGWLVNLVSSESRTIHVGFEADHRVLLFTALASIVSGVLFGLAPAWRGTEAALHGGVKDRARTVGGSRTLTTKVLVAAQVGASLVLLVGAGLFLRTLYNFQVERVGYDRENLVLVRLDPIAGGYRGDDIGRACIELMHRLAALPGARAVTFSENGLFSGTESGTQVDVEGFTPRTDEDKVARFDQVGPQYFTHVGIPLLLGRDIGEADAPGAPRVAVINETMAAFYFPRDSPIGRHIHVTGPSDVTLEIVGVAKDAQDHSFRDAPVRRFYVSYQQPIDGLTGVNVAIRTQPGAAIAAAARDVVQRFDRTLPILGIKSVNALMNETTVREQLIARLSTWLAALAILLAAIGLYGVMSYAVSRRTNEIGIRMALGARQSHVGLMIVRETVVLVLLGVAAGSVAALAVTRYVSSLIFGLAPHDALTFVAASAILVAVGLLAGYLPARRAARIDPLVALRYD